MGYQTRTDEVGRITATVAEPCKICSDMNKATYVVEQDYFLAFWLPVFPTSRKIFKVCSACNARLKVKPADPNMEWVNRNIPRKQKFRYYWGLLVLAGLGYFLYRFAVDNEMF